MSTGRPHKAELVVADSADWECSLLFCTRNLMHLYCVLQRCDSNTALCLYSRELSSCAQKCQTTLQPYSHRRHGAYIETQTHAATQRDTRIHTWPPQSVPMAPTLLLSRVTLALDGHSDIMDGCMFQLGSSKSRQ